MADDKQNTNAPGAKGPAAKKASAGKGAARKAGGRKSAAGKPAPPRPAEQKTVPEKTVAHRADAAPPAAEKLKTNLAEPKPVEKAAASFADSAQQPDELPAPDTESLKLETSAQAIAAAKDETPAEPPAEPVAPESEPEPEKSAAVPEKQEPETPFRPKEEAPLAAKAPVEPAPEEPAPSSPMKLSTNPPAKKPNITQEFVKMTDTEMMTKSFQSAMAEMTAKSQDAYKKSTDMFKEAGEFTKGNLEAMMESSKIFAAGMQEMGKAAVADSKSEFEALTAEVKEMASVKSPTDFFQLQSALLRKNFDKAVAMSSKNTEAMLKLANDAAQPLSTRMSLAMEKIKAA